MFKIGVAQIGALLKSAGSTISENLHRQSVLDYVGLVVPAFSVVALCTLALMALPLDRQIYRDRARDAIQSGAFSERAWLPFATATPPRYGQNDCLILAMLSTSSGSRVQDAVGPPRPHGVTPPEFTSAGFDRLRYASGSLPPVEHCYELKMALDGPNQIKTYANYIHGPLVAAGALLQFFTFHELSSLYLLLALLLPLGVTIGSKDRKLVSISAGSIVVTGTSHFASGLDLGPSAILIGCFLVYVSLRQPTNLVYAIFGALCAAFDLLTALLPAALIVVLLAADNLRTAVRGAVIFTASSCLAILSKYGISLAIMAGPQTTGSIWVHMSATGWSLAQDAEAKLASLGLSAAWAQNRVGGAFLAYVKWAYFSDLIGFGSRLIGLAFTVILPFMGFLLALSSKNWRVLLAFGVVAAWLTIFVEHSITNAIYMQRLATWLTIASAVALVESRKSRKWPAG